MNLRPALAPLAFFLLAAWPACVRGAELPPHSSADKLVDETAACPTPQLVALDAVSFVRSDVPAFTPERLETFRQAAASAFRSAAEAGCAVGELSPERLAALRRLLVQSASGATEATFYEDEQSAGAGTLVFQYVFAEADLALPEAADIRLGLACWIDPENEECAGREP